MIALNACKNYYCFACIYLSIYLFSYLFIYCVFFTYEHLKSCVFGNQRITCRRHFSPSTMQSLAHELKYSTLGATPFTDEHLNTLECMYGIFSTQDMFIRNYDHCMKQINNHLSNRKTSETHYYLNMGLSLKNASRLDFQNA